VINNETVLFFERLKIYFTSEALPLEMLSIRQIFVERRPLTQSMDNEPLKKDSKTEFKIP
jgi:hypothetical protein